MATEKLTLLVEPQDRDALLEWAREDGRPVANLLRRIVVKSIEQHRRRQPETGVAA